MPVPSRWPVLAAIAGGGVVGALSRYGLNEAFRHPVGGFAWATFTANVAGCLFIGVLMVLIDEAWAGRRLLRQFLGVGVLGGFTTFSTYVLDIQNSVDAGAAPIGLLYLAATVAGTLAAVWAGAAGAGWVVRVRRRISARRYERKAGDRR